MASNVEGPGWDDTPERSVLTAIMARLAEGDGAAIQSLIDSFRPQLIRAVRSISSHRNARLTAEQVDDLVLDAALAISDVASAWKPDGAPPWFYARGRIANAVDRLIGHWSDPLDHERFDAAEPMASPGWEADTGDVLEKLASSIEVAALLRNGLLEVASPRDLLVYVEHGVQVAMGDPSPAVTIGRIYGMKPAAVRQQTRRIKLRLHHLAETDPRYAELAALPLVALPLVA